MNTLRNGKVLLNRAVLPLFTAQTASVFQYIPRCSSWCSSTGTPKAHETERFIPRVPVFQLFSYKGPEKTIVGGIDNSDAAKGLANYWNTLEHWNTER